MVDLEFTEKGAHDESDALRALIQSRIDEAQRRGACYDAIVLGYGLCGNATVGLEARETRLVIPRAHDCCTLFLGSKLKFKEHFAGNPSQSFSTGGYMERGDSYTREGSVSKLLGQDKTYEDYVRLYGKENARHIVETMNASRTMSDGERVVFIDVPETRNPEHARECRARAEAEGKEYVEFEGSVRLVRKLLVGEWDSEDFLIVEPGQRTAGVYDWDEVIRAEKWSEPNETDTES